MTNFAFAVPGKRHLVVGMIGSGRMYGQLFVRFYLYDRNTDSSTLHTYHGPKAQKLLSIAQRLDFS